MEELNIPRIVSYADDFIICTNSFEETLHKKIIIIRIFKKHIFTFNLGKCTFHKTAVDYVGLKIKINKVTLNVAKVNTFPKP